MPFAADNCQGWTVPPEDNGNILAYCTFTRFGLLISFFKIFTTNSIVNYKCHSILNSSKSGPKSLVLYIVQSIVQSKVYSPVCLNILKFFSGEKVKLSVKSEEVSKILIAISLGPIEVRLL